MTSQPITLINSNGTLPDGVTLRDVEVRTVIQSAGRDHHVAKGARTVHTVEVLNSTRRNLLFQVDSHLPNDDVLYVRDDKPLSWPASVKVGGRKTGRDKASWEPAKCAMEHPADCPPENGHHVDIFVGVRTALDGENIEILATEEEHVYRFKCAC